MKKKIYQLAREEFEYSFAPLLLQEEKIEKTAEEGKSAKGTLFVRNGDNRRMKGVVYATAPFIKLKETAFSGTEALIDYELLSMDRKAGESLSGEICLITSCGECRAAVELKIKEDEETKKAGTLFRLANLARSDWEAAVEQYRKLYAKRTGGGPASQELEELLIDGKKKEKILLHTESQSFYYEPVEETFAESVVLRKNTWGYLKINVWADADFIQPEHKVIWSDNFIGDEYILEFLIQKEKLHAGKNYGRLYIKTIHQLLTIEVCAVCQEREAEKRLLRKRKEALLFMTHSYLKYRCGLLEKSAYVKEGLAWKKESKELFSEEEGQFLDIYYMAVDGQDTLAWELLKDIHPREVLGEGSCAYLTSLCAPEAQQREKAVESLRKLWREDSESRGVLWFLLQTDTELKENPEKRFTIISEYNKRHRTSVLFHIELLLALNEKPALLKRLDAALVAGINWGIRMNMVSGTVLERYVFLADKEEGLRKSVVKGLIELYRQKPSDDVLYAILSILVQEECYGSQYFSWYEKGVLKQLRIKGLYEAYLYSIEDRTETVIPKQVLTYFSYDNQLSDEGKERLYAYVIKNRERDRETWLSYTGLIEKFALKRLSEEALNRRLAVIYPEILKTEKLTDAYLKRLAGLLFRQEIICNNPNVVGVYVQHKEISVPVYFPLEKGRGDIYLYTENAKISFADESDCRYGSSIEYEIKPYMDLSGWQKECYRAKPGDSRLLLHLYERIEKYQKYDEDANEIRRRVLEIKGINRECQGECMTALIHQYFDKMEEEPLKELLLEIPPELVKEKERPKLIDYCILQGLNERAQELIGLWGYEEVPLNRLLRLTRRLLTKAEGKEEILLSLCSYLLRCERYNQDTLTYLVLYYEGTLSELAAIWEKAWEAGLEAWPLEERLLAQLLFTEGHVKNHMRIFASYYEKKRDRMLVRAYLNYYSFAFFRKEIYLPEEFFQIASRELDREYSRIMALAYLKEYSRRQELSLKEKRRVEEYLLKFLNKGEFFAFFKDFKDRLPIENGLLNRTFIEYRSQPDARVSLFFRLGDMEDFKVIPMTGLGYGIYSASFLLFPDENLQYYITEMDKGKEIITESSSIMENDESRELEDSDFGLLGAILAARRLKDDGALEELMKEYILQSYRKEKLFRIL